ncbi:hypothetical protein LzC2_18360 [Planctomycetes bacterium LzC2]|uniref:Uncharacterized protein n=1 Tax=Alienimonas chondri TaxID=2681879 RepID=A0ABX1VCZ5_9PLAN|nr:hypothetical protein [Alienimonas chondri]
MRGVVRHAGRRWALAGPLGWTAAVALANAADLGSVDATIDWPSLPAAAAIGLIGGGLAAAIRGAEPNDDRGWR